MTTTAQHASEATVVHLGLRVGDVFVSEAGTVREVLSCDSTEVRIVCAPKSGRERDYWLSLRYVASALRCNAWGVKQ